MKKYIKNIQISLCSSCILFLVGGKIPIIPNQYVFANESAISSYSTGITGESDGVIKYGQPQKTIPGNGQPYLISQGLTVYGNKGSSEWIFIADETVTISTLHVFVCGVGNTYIEYTLSISGPGKYVLDASIYGAFNQGLALVINNQPKPQEMTGHVNIHYVDEDGEPLRPQVSLPSRTWLESEATPEYQTLATSLYLTSIEKDGEIYVLDESKIPTNADGSYIAGQTVDVTYVYKLQPEPQEMTGHVNIHYVDEDGEPLRPQVSLPSRTWLESEATPEYQTLATPLYLTSIEKDGEIYVLDESKIPTNADGSYIAGQTVDVTYVYKLQPEPQEMTGHVNIHYLDESGEPLSPHVSLPSRTWLESEATPEYQTLATPLYLTSIEKDGEIYV
ncbi:MucBP domain-containing protein, partial [Lactococcus formosensis]